MGTELYLHMPILRPHAEFHERVGEARALAD